MRFPDDRREPRPFEPPPWEDAGAGGTDERQAEEAPAPEEPGPAATETPDAPDEAKMDAMIIGLSVEERDDFANNTFVWGMVAAVFVGFVGAVLSGYAAVVFARMHEAGPVALAGSVIVGMMGFMLVASAVWLGVRTYDKRGV